jgi:hypothetical protein
MPRRQASMRDCTGGVETTGSLLGIAFRERVEVCIELDVSCCKRVTEGSDSCS